MNVMSVSIIKKNVFAVGAIIRDGVKMRIITIIHLRNGAFIKLNSRRSNQLQ